VLQRFVPERDATGVLNAQFNAAAAEIRGAGRVDWSAPAGAARQPAPRSLARPQRRRPRRVGQCPV
jgi:hypothetical protein